MLDEHGASWCGCRSNYQKYLLAYERQARALGLPVAGEGEEVMTSEDSQGEDGQDSGTAAEEEGAEEVYEAAQSAELEDADVGMTTPEHGLSMAGDAEAELTEADTIDLTGEEPAADSVAAMGEEFIELTDSPVRGSSAAAAEVVAPDEDQMAQSDVSSLQQDVDVAAVGPVRLGCSSLPAAAEDEKT